MKFNLVIIMLALVVISCGTQNDVKDSLKAAPPISLSESFPGGETTVPHRPFASFMRPAKNLPEKLKPEFHAGKALAHQPWVKAPTITTARDGLGPLYNARTCLACHINGGRGKMPDDGSDVLLSAFLRVSLPGYDKVNGVIGEPTYGDQFQSQSVALSHQLRAVVKDTELKNKEVAPEGYVYIDWLKKTYSYADGEDVALRLPKIRIENLSYGPLHKDTLIGIRLAPPIHGMGLIEAITQASIEQNADPDDVDNDGISGRINQVWDFEKKQTVAGRFGLKANKSSIRFQVAGAFAGDMGITNPVFPKESCTQSQELCLVTPNGNEVAVNDMPPVELSDSLLKLVVDFNKNIAVPKRRNETSKKVIAGRELFYQINCNSCHNPSYVTGTATGFPHLSNQQIWPYSDFLLHDMGPELADGRTDYLAAGSEWRTPPLWGVGLNQKVNGSDNLLHDGRAQSVEAAVLWHGGEAQTSKENFSKLNKKQRTALVAFVNSL